MPLRLREEKWHAGDVGSRASGNTTRLELWSSRGRQTGLSKPAFLSAELNTSLTSSLIQTSALADAIFRVPGRFGSFVHCSLSPFMEDSGNLDGPILRLGLTAYPASSSSPYCPGSLFGSTGYCPLPCSYINYTPHCRLSV